MASPSIFSRSHQEQQIVLQTMDQAAGGVKGGEALSKNIVTTEARIREVSDQVTKLSTTVSAAFTSTKKTMQTAVGGSQTIDFNSLPVRANLNDNFFGSEQRAYKATLTKISQITAQIPALDLTYFSADYSATITQAKITEFVNDVDIFEEGNEGVSFLEVTESIKEFTKVLMGATKAIVTIAAKGEIVKSLQAKTIEIKSFEHDRFILTNMIHLRNTHFQDVERLKALITILAKENDDALFTEVFGNLFAKASAEEFMTLFKHFHDLINSAKLEGQELGFTNTFLYYLEQNIAPYVEGENFAVSSRRKELIQEYFMDLASKYEENAAKLSWNIQFIVNNPNLFTSNLGGATRAPGIFTEIINTTLFGPEVDFASMNRRDFKRLLLQRQGDAPARVSGVITREIYEITAFREVYDKLAETESTLRAAQDLVWARPSSPGSGYETASHDRTPDRVSLEDARQASTSSFEDYSEEDWSEGEEEEIPPSPVEAHAKPKVAPKPDLSSRRTSHASSNGGDLASELAKALNARTNATQ